MLKIIGNWLIISLKLLIKKETRNDIRDSYEKGNFNVAIILILINSVPFIIWVITKLKKRSNRALKEE